VQRRIAQERVPTEVRRPTLRVRIVFPACAW
jgi:hypothetical protein